MSYKHLLKQSLIIACICLITLPTITGCTASKGTANARQFYRNVVAFYNGYFNAREITRNSVEKLEEQHEDNYMLILDVFPLGDETAAQSITPDMEKVYKKCTRIIKQHDQSEWLAESYLMIGTSYFYRQDYFGALETFEYIIGRFSAKQPAYESMVWMVKTYTKLEYYREAQALITSIRNEKEFPEELKKDLHLAAADLHIQLGNYRSAISELELAVSKINRKKHRARYQFILAQLYMETNQDRKASELFRKVARKNVSYEMAFHSEINSVRAMEVRTPRQYREAKGYLQRMLRDDKNLGYNDVIYYEMAQLELIMRNHEQAAEYLKKSILLNVDNPDQKAFSHLSLADFYFERRNYSVAKAHYDSAGQSITEFNPEYDAVMAKVETFEPLSEYYITIEREDSLQQLAKLPPEEIEKLVNRMIEDEEARAKAEERERELDEFRVRDGGHAGFDMPDVGDAGGGMADIGTGSNWYFYNASALGRGYSQFTRTWGNRPLTDNWRVQALQKEEIFRLRSEEAEDVDTAQQEDEITEEPAPIEGMPEELAELSQDKQQYMQDIPFMPAQLNVSNNRIMEAYFQIGFINFQKLKNYKESINSLETLLERFPDGRFTPQAYYYLHESYRAIEEEENAKVYADKLKAEYPESEYTALLGHDGHDITFVRSSLNAELEAELTKAYNLYLQNNCTELDKHIAMVDTVYRSNYLKPRFDYYAILCKGRNVENYPLLNELEYFIESYPDEKITEHAKSVRDFLQQKASGVTEEKAAKDGIYQADRFAKHFFCIKVSKGHTSDIRSKISDFNRNIHSDKNLRLTTIALGDDQNLILIQDFGDKENAMRYLRSIEANREIMMQFQSRQLEHFLITQENFRVLLEDKKIDTYLNFYKRNYL